MRAILSLLAALVAAVACMLLFLVLIDKPLQAQEEIPANTSVTAPENLPIATEQGGATDITLDDVTLDEVALDNIALDKIVLDDMTDNVAANIATGGGSSVFSAIEGSGIFWPALFLGLAVVIVATVRLFHLYRGLRLTHTGFELINPGTRRIFVPLPKTINNSPALDEKHFRIYLNNPIILKRILISKRRQGLQIEDRNSNNVLVVNRRRTRRTILRDMTVIDIGGLTVVYRDAVARERSSATIIANTTADVLYKDPRGPIRKGHGVLTIDGRPHRRPYYITKNLTYIGRSENSDVVIKANGSSYREAIIERVGDRYKLIDANGGTSVQVNNRRVDRKTLRSGDQIRICDLVLNFRLVTDAAQEYVWVERKARNGVVDEGSEQHDKERNGSGTENPSDKYRGSGGGHRSTNYNQRTKTVRNERT